ncbi:hypothetical protein CATYP_03860 [Corynebacterium atypicum]|uniref:Uncharacterized protein n=1 Tax=Corynebacterium atypicum TaxID=191610 RepID=A0ABM5QME7_9CORY|nr:hypothetical protein [Corynebacterium atypicum]AIG63930.1 hypothetical protein CATYP_03860 [Corynebacterium atypicum]
MPLAPWRDRANARLRAGAQHLEQGMIGHAALFEPIDNRRYPSQATSAQVHDIEAAMLLDPDARLGSDGVYRA